MTCVVYRILDVHSTICLPLLAWDMRWIRYAGKLHTSFGNTDRAFEWNLCTSQVRMCACSGMNGVRRLMLV